jgi:hypothetical protein
MPLPFGLRWHKISAIFVFAHDFTNVVIQVESITGTRNDHLALRTSQAETAETTRAPTCDDEEGSRLVGQAGEKACGGHGAADCDAGRPPATWPSVVRWTRQRWRTTVE